MQAVAKKKKNDKFAHYEEDMSYDVLNCAVV